MSMNTPTGGITQITPIKNFQEISELDNEQYLLGIKDYSTGSGGKVKFKTLISDSISENNDNIITTGTDGKLLVNTPPQIGNLSNLTTTNKSTLVGAINEVDGDVGNLANLTTSVKTNVVNAINSEVSARNTAETNIQNDYNGKIGTLSNLDTTDKSNIVGAINELAAIAEPSLQYETMNNSKALETGAPSENAIILADIQKYAHSSFDRSKFTVVGSPIITDDGIASGFTTSSYLTKTISELDYSKDFDFISPIATLASNTSEKYIIIDDSGGFRISQHLAKVKFQLKLNADTSLTSYNILNDLQVGDKVQGRIKKEGTNLYLYARKNNEDWVAYSSNPIEGVSTLNADNAIKIGFHGGGDAYCWDGSVDLKYLSVKVDGVPVFSGNKTGIDTIKPDDYTVVGTPTISADGIASGFNSSNYITVTVPNFDVTKPFEILSPIFSQSTTDGDVHYILQTWSDGSQGLRLNVLGTNIQIQYKLDGESSYTTVQKGNIITANNKYQVKVIFTGSVYKFQYQVITNNSGWQDIGTEVTSSTKLSGTNTTFYVGGHSSNPYGFQNGSLDLNAFKIYVDGDLVYQPCLKIPYTESFTGSKVVDAIYRDRVVDVYEQGYPQRFYTLQEDKKGNYAVIGNPTISSDFVASGFSNSNYLTKPSVATISNNGEFHIDFKFNNTQYTSNQYILDLYNTTSNELFIRRNSNGNDYQCIIFVSGTSVFNKTITDSSNDISGYIEYKNGVYTLDINGVKETLTSTTKMTATTYNLSLGARLSSNTGDSPLINGSVDLKECKMHVDNKLAYEAIIDPNFALPMGEIYGDIEYNRANKLDLTTANATQETVTKINGWCIPDYANGVGKVVNTVYQAAKNVYVKILNNTDGGAAGYIYIGTTNNPATEIAQWGGNVATANTIYYMIPKGYYYKVSGTGIYSITEFPFMGE